MSPPVPLAATMMSGLQACWAVCGDKADMAGIPRCVVLLPAVHHPVSGRAALAYSAAGGCDKGHALYANMQKEYQ